MTKAKELGIREFPYYEYDLKGKVNYYEDSDGFWYKAEYDPNGNMIYYEDSFEYWVRREYDSNGNEVYRENSLGEITGTKRSDKIKDSIINDQFNQIEELTKRYNEAEIFIMGLNWFERLFISRKVRKFILSRLKYKF